MERCVAGRSPVLRRQVQQRPSVAADTGRSGVWLRLRQQGDTCLSLSLSLSLSSLSSLSSRQNRPKVGFWGGGGGVGRGCFMRFSKLAKERGSTHNTYVLRSMCGKKSVGVFFLSFSLAANRFFFRQSHWVFYCVLTLVYYPQAEIKSVLDLGVCPERIIYANPCKQASHLKYACKKGVATMTFDNEVELYKVRPFMRSTSSSSSSSSSSSICVIPCFFTSSPPLYMYPPSLVIYTLSYVYIYILSPLFLHFLFVISAMMKIKQTL